MARKDRSPEDFIRPLNLGGMRGRILHLPAQKKHQDREILFIYGQHASLERMWGLMEVLNRYGAVTMPDLPGFGGMDSLYKVGNKPTLDNLAEYLATFMRWRYKRRRVTVAGLSFGFLVITRMLQLYPELAKKIDLVISAEGFAHFEDFKFSRRRFLFYKYGSAFFSLRSPAWIFQHIILRPAWLRLAYHRSHNARDKFVGKHGDDFKAAMDMEIRLWRINDIRTQMFCNGQMFTLDNCSKSIDLPLYHVYVKNDQYLDQYRVEQHLRIIFDNFNSAQANIDSHSMSYIADAKAASKLVPLKLRRVLRGNPR